MTKEKEKEHGREFAERSKKAETTPPEPEQQSAPPSEQTVPPEQQTAPPQQMPATPPEQPTEETRIAREMLRGVISRLSVVAGDRNATLKLAAELEQVLGKQ